MPQHQSQTQSYLLDELVVAKYLLSGFLTASSRTIPTKVKKIPRNNCGYEIVIISTSHRTGVVYVDEKGWQNELRVSLFRCHCANARKMTYLMMMALSVAPMKRNPESVALASSPSMVR